MKTLKQKIIELHLDDYSQPKIAKLLKCSTGSVAYHLNEKVQEKHFETQRKRRADLKQKAVDYLGGDCEKCGYNDCAAAMDFHHKDPTQKDPEFKKRGASIGTRSRSFEKLKIELDKCMLLCCRCHRELHANFAHSKTKGTNKPRVLL